MAAIKVYGADWCHMTRSTLEHLDEISVDYDYVDIDDDPKACQWVKDHNAGKAKKPTIDVAGTVLTTPSDEKLDAALEDAGLFRRAA
jgi:mycoredoxin